MIPLGFTAPLVLGALVLIPAIWYLLRLTPPRPREQRFPATRLLLDLVKRDEQPARSPWWLTALRLALATLVILALSGPVWRPETVGDAAKGPLWLVVDNGWAASSDWKERAAAATRQIEAAQEASRPVALVLTAEGAQQPLAPEDATAALRRLGAAEPRPWWPDRAGLIAGLRDSAAKVAPGSITWVSDGLATGDDTFAATLRALAPAAPVTVIERSGPPSVALIAASNGSESLNATVRRAETAGTPGGRLKALDQRGREIAASDYRFEAGKTDAEAAFNLPTELRNEIARIEIEGANSAGAVQLVDERWRRRKVGLISGATADSADQPLLSPVHYLSRALAPFADLRQPHGDVATAVDALTKDKASVIVTADVGTIPPATEKTLEQWVSAGGVLLRFAGPRLAASPEADRLIPVDLRQGGRSLGGALTWGQPQGLGPFPASGPFAGMPVPRDVSVNRQVLANPGPDLASRTWASLTDGTPLVTANRLGNGWIVLFHVTADPSWSSLPLSGSFLEMLRRVVSFSVATSEGAGDPNQPQSLLPPWRLIDGLGRSTTPSADARPLAPADMARLLPGREHPPGLYGSEDAFQAFNLMRPETKLARLDLSPLGSVRNLPLVSEGPRDLRPSLMTMAAILILVDALAVLALAGALGRRRFTTAAAVIAAMILVPTHDLRAADAAREAFDKSAALGTHIAYVATGKADLDEVSKLGLEALSRALADRTALEPADPVAIDVERDELAFFPLIYWPIDPAAPRPSAKAMARIDAYMKNGGTVLFDTRDTLTNLNMRNAGGGSPSMNVLRDMLADLDIPPLEPVPSDHVITKAFYILHDFPGRYANGPLWIEALPAADPAHAAERPVRAGDGVSPIMITGNDLAGAWAQGPGGDYLLPTVPNDPRQREMALRVGINIVMYTLTGNYKADQVHVPALLERLGQ